MSQGSKQPNTLVKIKLSSQTMSKICTKFRKFSSAAAYVTWTHKPTPETSLTSTSCCQASSQTLLTTTCQQKVRCRFDFVNVDL